MSIFFLFVASASGVTPLADPLLKKKKDIRAAEIELPPEFSVYYARSWTEPPRDISARKHLKVTGVPQSALWFL